MTKNISLRFIHDLLLFGNGLQNDFIKSLDRQPETDDY